MPALPFVPGVAKFELLWTQNGLPAANILHTKYTGTTPASATLTAFCQGLAAAFWVSPFRADYSTETVLVGVRATDLASDTGASGEHDVSLAGTAEAGPSPAQCCVLANLSIARRYRGGHPRIYLPGVAAGEILNASTWNSAILSDVNGALAAINTYFNGTVVSGTTLAGWCSVSYRSGNAPRAVPLVDPILGYAVSTIIRSQRRRVSSSSY